MTNQDIYDLIACFDRSTAQTMRLSLQDFTIELTVCLIEAMKMMSEVSAPCDCVIEEVVKANGELAAFGEPLFRYRPC